MNITYCHYCNKEIDSNDCDESVPTNDCTFACIECYSSKSCSYCGYITIGDEKLTSFNDDDLCDACLKTQKIKAIANLMKLPKVKENKIKTLQYKEPIFIGNIINGHYLFNVAGVNLLVWFTIGNNITFSLENFECSTGDRFWDMEEYNGIDIENDVDYFSYFIKQYNVLFIEWLNEALQQREKNRAAKIAESLRNEQAELVYDLCENELNDIAEIHNIGVAAKYNEYGYYCGIYINGYYSYCTDNYGNSSFGDVQVSLDNPSRLPLLKIAQYALKSGKEFAKENLIPFLGIEYDKDGMDSIEELINN